MGGCAAFPNRAFNTADHFLLKAYNGHSHKLISCPPPPACLSSSSPKDLFFLAVRDRIASSRHCVFFLSPPSPFVFTPSFPFLSVFFRSHAAYTPSVAFKLLH